MIRRDLFDLKLTLLMLFLCTRPMLQPKDCPFLVENSLVINGALVVSGQESMKKDVFSFCNNMMGF